MTRGCGEALISQPRLHTDFSGLGGPGGSAPLAEVSLDVEAPSSFEDQGIFLAPPTTTPNDKVPAATHSPKLLSGVLAVCKGSGRLLALVLRLPPGPGGMAGGRGRLPRGDLGGGFVAISLWRDIPTRS